MNPIQVKDWASATADPGSTYELVYQVIGSSDNRALADSDFKLLLEQRKGVSVKSTARIGTGVMKATVTVSYMSGMLGAQLGQSLFTSTGHEYKLVNVFILRDGPGFANLVGPVSGKLNEETGFAVSRAANAFSDTLERVGLTPFNLSTIGTLLAILLVYRLAK